jgi:hypothetical protein
MTADVEPFSRELQNVAVLIRWNPQTQSRVAIGKGDQTATGREAADQFNRKPVDSMQ